MADNLLFFAVVFGIGILAGSGINTLVRWLPAYLYRQWVNDARAVLSLAANHPTVMTETDAHSAMRRVVVIVGCGLLSVTLVHHFAFSLEGLAFILLTWALIALSLVDADHKLLPDIIILPLIWSGLIVNSFSFYTTITSALWGAIGGYMSLWTVSFLFRSVAGREGIGHGDLKLMSVIGAWGGWQVLPYTVFFAASLGVLVYSVNRLGSSKSREHSGVVPFGPYISAAGWIVMIYSINNGSFPF